MTPDPRTDPAAGLRRVDEITRVIDGSQDDARLAQVQ
jgi:hypothetical protein